MASQSLGDILRIHLTSLSSKATRYGHCTYFATSTVVLTIPKYHPEANIKKMSAGIPLVDSDRWDWLTRLQEECLDRLSGSRGLVVTCSALKRKYRDVIRAAVAYNHNLVVRFVYLSADEALLIQRVGARLGHFFGADLVHSQMIILEEPKPRENDIIKVDVSGDLESVKKEVLARIHRVYQKDPYLDDTPPSSPA